MSNPSKAKGTKFETKIKDILTKELGIKFERVPLSGSLTYLKGDLWSPEDSKAFPFTCELKHYESIEWNNLLTAKSTDIHEFWRQTVRESEVMKKHPLLIFRWDRSKDFCAWNDNKINLESQLTVKAFENQFHIGLLDDWLTAYKKVYK